MIIGNCTFCGGIVRISTGVNPATSVRCPLCNQTSKLSTILEAAVPQLEIVETPAAANSESIPMIDRIELKDEATGPKREPDGKFVVSPVLSKGAKRRNRRKPGERGKSTADDRQTPESHQATRSPATTRPRRRSSNRRRRADNQFASRGRYEILKVVLGAVLAIPVAQLMIWWWVSVDPLNLGPAVSRVLPAVVPAKFRSEEMDESPIGPETEAKSES